ncbi:MAG: O-methyltransferase [Thermoanaerobaculia bacterium]|nr:O-methyltransferase [Thermoanaerobaculia bacterium]
MKEGPGTIVRAEQARYLEDLLPPRDPLLREMEEVAEEEGIPISDPEVGRLLTLLARFREADRILEVGTAIGYGVLCLARGSATARITSIDPDEKRLERARGYLKRAGVDERVDLIAGEALEVLPDLSGPWDLVYLDARKEEYRRYLDLTLPRVAVGGMISVDNLLWKGRVADPPEDDPVADAIRRFNPYFMIHPQLDSVLLPLGDGVGLGVKKKQTILEMGGPF